MGRNVFANEQRTPIFEAQYSSPIPTRMGTLFIHEFSASMSIKKHTVLNVLGLITPIPVTILVVPFMLDTIGLERYGVLAISYILLGYFGLMNLGLGRATAHRIARHRNAASTSKAEMVATAVILNIGFGMIGALLVGPAAWIYFTFFLETDSALSQEASGAAFWLSLALPLGLISGVFSGALQGLERFVEINIVSALNSILLQVMPLLAALYISPDLSVLLPAAFFSRVIALLALFLICARYISFRSNFRFDRKVARDLLGFGGWVTVTSIIGPLLDTLDRLILGSLSGPAAVTFYSVPSNLLRRATVFSIALSSALFPRFASITDKNEAKELLEKAVFGFVAILTPIFVLTGMFLESFIILWIDASFASISAPVGAVLLIGVWANSAAHLPYALLQGTGRPDLVAKCHAAEVIPYLSILVLLIVKFGVLGASIGWSLRCVLDAAILFMFSVGKKNKIWIALAVSCAVVLLETAIILILPVQSVMRWGCGLSLLLISFVISWKYGQGLISAVSLR